MPGERARLTVPDVLFLLLSFGFLAALYPVFWDGLQANADKMSTGTAYLFQLLLPFAILVLFTMIYATAVRGVRL